MEEGEFTTYRAPPLLVRVLTHRGIMSEVQTQEGKIMDVLTCSLDKPFTPHESVVRDWPVANPNRAVKTYG